MNGHTPRNPEEFLNRWAPRLPARVRGIVAEQKSSATGVRRPAPSSPFASDAPRVARGIPVSRKQAWTEPVSAPPPAAHRAPPPSTSASHRAALPDAAQQRIKELEQQVFELKAQLAHSAGADAGDSGRPQSAPPMRLSDHAARSATDESPSSMSASAEFDLWARSRLGEAEPKVVEYLQSSGRQFEETLGEALKAVSSEGENTDENVIRLGHALLLKVIPDLHRRVPNLEDVLEPGRPGEFDIELRHLLVSGIEAVRRKKEKTEVSVAESSVDSPASSSRGISTAASGTSTPKRPDELRPISSWVESFDFTGVQEVVRKALIMPVEEYRASEQHRPTDPNELEMEYVEMLADKTHDWMSMMLDRSKVVQSLARTLLDATRKFKREVHGEHSEDADQESKFFEDDDGVRLECAPAGGGEYGSTDVFYRGLDGFLGPPNPNLDDTVSNEHCKEEDSCKEFQVPNYHTKTTSEREYWFVADPSDVKLAELGLAAWPKETRGLSSATVKPSRSSSTKGSEAAGGNRHRANVVLPDGEEVEVDRHRRPVPLETIVESAAQKNEKLRDLNMDPMQHVEIICARLYTGPMYCKYNTVLRDIGHLLNQAVNTGSKQGVTLSGKEISKMLAAHQQQQAKEEEGKIVSARKGNGFPGHTSGNLYTTTLHVINSAVIKLGKLTQAMKVFRGISFRTMPKQFKRADEETKTRGGIEYGFTSCSTDESQAKVYAKPSTERNKTPIILEMQQGMIDRGADLSWLSQYPHEREILFPPLMGVEILTTSVKESVLHVVCRPSVNLNSLPIEAVIAKMQRSHIQLLDLLTDGLRFAGVPTRAMQALASLKVIADENGPSYYNATANYQAATTDAIRKQKEVFRYLTSTTQMAVDTLAEIGPDSIMEVARLAAATGEQVHAVDLLLLWRKKVRQEANNVEAESVAVALKHVMGYLLESGLQMPWPYTIAELASPRCGPTHGYTHKTECISKQDFVDLAQKALADRPEPFRDGARVLVITKQQSTSDSWRRATIVQRYAEGHEKREEGYMFEVHIPGVGKKDLPEEGVVAPSEGGIPAVLRVAAEKGDIAVVECLLDAKANLYETDKRANTALILASRGSQAAVIRILLESPQGKPKSNQPKGWLGFEKLRNSNRQEAFDIAVAYKAVEAKRALLKAVTERIFADAELHALVNECETVVRDKLLSAKDELWLAPWNVTALMIACRSGHRAVVEQLLEAKADVHARTARGSVDDVTALAIAAEEGLHDIVAALLHAGANADENWKDEKHNPGPKYEARTPLMWAAENGHASTVQLLLEHKATAEAYRANGRNVLMMACQYGQTEVVRRLIEHGASVNGRNSSGETALMFCSRNGHTNTASLLLEHKIDVDSECEKDLFTSLHRAVGNGHTATARVLLDACPKLLEVRDPASRFAVGGGTPLMAAALTGQASSVLTLLDHGADLSKVNNAGQSAIFIAAMNGHVQALNFMLKALKTKRMLKSDLLDAFAPPEKGLAFEQRLTPLMRATLSLHDTVVAALLNAKANPLKVDHPDDLSALKLAAATGIESIVHLLLESQRAQKTERHVERHIQAARETAEKHGHTNVIAVFEKADSLHSVVSLRKEASMRGSIKDVVRAQSFSSDTFFDRENMIEVTQKLKWAWSSAFPGQIVPPRPNGAEMEKRETPLGPLVCHRGIVLQGGPYNGVFIRVGCVPRFPWVELWQALKKAVTHFIDEEKKLIAENRQAMQNGSEQSLYASRGIYVVVSLRAMQAIDFGWLVERNFQFHHYRKPGHGDTPVATAEGGGMAAGGATAYDEGTAEFVYYCWPGDPKDDLVPLYSSSIEGTAALCFSPDGTKLLLVQEHRTRQGAWNAPASKINAGECKVEALALNVAKEVGVEIDKDRGMQYLGGWSAGRARDNLSNDNFSAFAVTVKSESFEIDRAEIAVARWFEWRPLYEQWKEKGKPTDAKGRNVEGLDLGVADGPNVLSATILRGLDVIQNGQACDVKVKTSKQGPMSAMKASWGACMS